MIGLVIGGIASGVGKTTLTLGLIGALRRRGLVVQPFKVGPDYIDPSHHTQAAGRSSRNLDSWMVPEGALRELFWRAAGRADAAIVEGVMGLFDGRTGGGEIGSTAHVAKLLGLPVLLIVDAAKAARSVAATVLGCLALDPLVPIIGVVLNNVSGQRHAEIGREAIEGLTGLPVLGWLPRDDGLRQEERYLGLVPAAERRLPGVLLDRSTTQVREHIDLDRLVRLATVSVQIPPSSGLLPSEPIPARTRIAVAQDAAFNFYYQDSLDLLEAWGAELVPFSPLGDSALPPALGAVYLGGGFPELFAADLAANRSMLASIRAAASSGLPLYAECGGLMYLQQRLTAADGRKHEMAGVLPGTSTLTEKRLTLGYREARPRRSTLLADSGVSLRGHEFHWSRSDPPSAPQAAYDLDTDPPRLEGFAVGGVLASYLHVHLASNPSIAPRFVQAAARAGGDLHTPPWPMRGANLGRDTRMEGPRGLEAGTPDIPFVSMAPDPSLARRGVGDEVLPGLGGKLSPPPTPGLLLRQYGLPPDEIEALSRRRIEDELGSRLPASEPERGLVARLVYAAGDPSLIDLVQLAGTPIQAAVAAFRRGGRLIVDVGMVEAGISQPLRTRLGLTLEVALRAPCAKSLAREHGITRSAAGILALADRLDGAVVVIGNAPTALLTLLDLAAGGQARPSVVIGVPVGYVAAAESKALLLESGLPCITIEGTRGGSGLAAAAANYLLRLASEASIES